MFRKALVRMASRDNVSGGRNTDTWRTPAAEQREVHTAAKPRHLSE